MPTFRSIMRWFATFGMEMGNPAADAFNVGLAWYAQGNFDMAIAEFSEAIRLDPSYAHTYHNRGAAWYAKKEFDKAIEDFSAALRIDSKLALAYGGRGRAWQDLRKYELALNDFDEALRLDPDDALNYANRGSVWHAKLEYDAAIADYSEAIRLDPSLAWTYCARGAARLALQERDRATPIAVQLDRPPLAAPVGSRARLGYDLALADFDAALRIDPNDANTYCQRAAAWSALGEFGRAVDDCTEAIRLDPKFVHALAARGHAWRDMQQYQKAIDDFNAAIAIAPQNVSAINGLAWLLGSALDADARDGPRAVALAQQALVLDPDNVAWMDTLAVAYAEAGDFEQASVWQERALQNPPPQFEAEMRARLDLYRKGLPYRQEKRGPIDTQIMR